MKNIESKLKIIGIYQLLGGIIGVLNTIRLLPEFSLINSGIASLLLAIFGLYIFSSYCGYQILKKNYLKGINYSINNQFLQVIGFAVLGYAFHFTAGIYAGVKINLTHDSILSFMLGHSAARIDINSNPQNIEMSFNILALILISILYKLKEKVEKTYELRNS